MYNIHIIGDGRQADIVEEILFQRRSVSILSRRPYGKTDYACGEYFVIAFGANAPRLRIARELFVNGLIPYSIIHSSAIKADSAIVDIGVQILESAVISCKSQVGFQCMVNVGSLVGHHAIMEPGSSLAAHCTLGAGSTLGERSSLGNGAITISDIKICSDVIIGAGAVVTKDITEPGTYVGVPAKRIK